VDRGSSRIRVFTVIADSETGRCLIFRTATMGVPLFVQVERVTANRGLVAAKEVVTATSDRDADR